MLLMKWEGKKLDYFVWSTLKSFYTRLFPAHLHPHGVIPELARVTLMDLMRNKEDEKRKKKIKIKREFWFHDIIQTMALLFKGRRDYLAANSFSNESKLNRDESRKCFCCLLFKISMHNKWCNGNSDYCHVRVTGHPHRLTLFLMKFLNTSVVSNLVNFTLMPFR